MKKVTLLTAAFMLSLTSVAQQKVLTLEQAVLRQYADFRPQTLANFSWKANVNAYTYTEGDSIIEVSVPSGMPKTVMTLELLNRLLSADSIPALKRLAYTWASENVIKVFSAPYLAFVDVGLGKITRRFTIPEEAENLELSPNNTSLAYTVANNLYITDAKGTPVAVTTNDNPGIVNGQAVHRNEFGINKGIFWSPGSSYLAYYRMDETMVTDYPLVDITQRIARVEPVKYPMAGMKSHEVTLRVYNLSTHSNIEIKTGLPAEQYLTCVTWSPDEKSIFIATLNREQNHMRLNRYSAQTGELMATLFEETDSEYVEPQQPLAFLDDNSGRFIWQSRRDGWNHLYLYDVNGKLLRQLTRGEWEVTDINAIDLPNGKIYITATRESPIERQVYAVDLKKDNITMLTQGAGFHNALFSPDCKYFVDFYSSISIPNRVNLCTGKGKIVKNLVNAPNPLASYSVSIPELLTLKADDGTTLYGRMIRPVNFDSTRRYPVVIYVYGGPHSQLVRNSWMGGASLWECYMASRGYILFTLDNRGTSYRGSNFEQTIHRRLGTIEIADQLTGVNFLKSLPYVDSTRIGVHGWSFGGFMTISLMLRAPEFFKVGVAGGPVTDWKFYEVMYGERYMDTPQENPDGYSTSDLKQYVKNLKGKLLIIHDDMDKTVVPQNSLTLLHEFVKSNVQVDFFLYPQHEHNVMGKDRVHLIDKIIRYFDENL